MNPFLSFLIFVPLLGSLFLSVVCLTLFFEKGPRVDIAAGFFLTAGLCAYLAFVFKKTLTPKDATLEVPGLENIGQEQKKSLTNLYLISTYLGLTFFGLIFFGYEVMKGFIGVLALVLGGFLIWFSILVERSRNVTPQTLEFRVNRAMFPRHIQIYFLLVVALGIIVTLSYKFALSWHFISPWDIAGVLFFLASTCLWLGVIDRKQQRDFHASQ